MKARLRRSISIHRCLSALTTNIVWVLVCPRKSCTWNCVPALMWKRPLTALVKARSKRVQACYVAQAGFHLSEVLQPQLVQALPTYWLGHWFLMPKAREHLPLKALAMALVGMLAICIALTTIAHVLVWLTGRIFVKPLRLTMIGTSVMFPVKFQISRVLVMAIYWVYWAHLRDA